MENRLQFKEKLSGILALAKSMGRRIATEEIEKYFEEEQLSKEQFDLVYDYLLSQKVVVKGYEKIGGAIKDGAENQPIPYTEDEEKYLRVYMNDLSAIPSAQKQEREILYGQVVNGDVKAKNRLVELYLPEVVKIAKEHHTPLIFLGDMVQEGNVSLLLAMDILTDDQTAHKQIISEIHAGIQVLIEEQADVKQRDKRMIEKVDNLEQSRKELTQAMGREVSGEELSEYTNLPIEEVVDILKLLEISS